MTNLEVNMADVVVVAMGGNSLLDPSLPPTVENQFAMTARGVGSVADLLASGRRVVLTHGNGPQVGFMKLRSDLARKELHEVPLDSLVADSQGAIGYMLQRHLRDSLAERGLSVPVVTLITEVVVDPKDPALANPTKPIGGFYSASEAERLRGERGWQIVEDSSRGWRRVVPSPVPREIVQLDTIRKLVRDGTTVIACGGGGIPVVPNSGGRTQGLEAVIDKDLASALLASELGARQLCITTGVDAIYVDFQTESRRALQTTTAEELARLAEVGQFPPGSMGPKVRASIEFLRRGGEEVVICKPEALGRALDGGAGTRIRNEERAP